MSKLYITRLLCIIAVIIILGSCSKSIKDDTEGLSSLNPAKTDINAGSWKPILLSSASEFAVQAPAPANTPDFKAQLNEIKNRQANISGEENAMVQYWNTGGVLRWNEIMRELVAKHNLPPYQNPDGSYPVPDPNNPLAYPQFPFANPPYAARAYAYISAAQYDALVAAWYYKKLYNRAPPYKLDSTINTLAVKSDLPSYPSEDGVLAGVMMEMMKLLFPGDQDFIQTKAEEQERAAIVSGKAVRSDIQAGESLGRQIAQKFIARARSDRAGAAVGTPAQWNQMEQDALARGEIPWISQEVPKRPPMLPLFGKVKPFLFDSLTVISLRAPAPPSTNSEQFKLETREVLYYSTHYDRERIRIVHLWADGINTPTPPGHWNQIAVDEFIKKNFSEVRWARNMALLNMAMMDAVICCWDTKYAYFNPRPSQVDPRIKTFTGLPNFPSYISGHSTFSSAAALVLGYILPDKAAAFESMAEEAAISRLYGAIHYRSDVEAGKQVGQRVGQYAVLRGQSDGAGD